MEKLIYVIGKAPSEIPREELMKKLNDELIRMNYIVDELAPKKRVKRATKKKSKKQTQLSLGEIGRLAKLAGIDMGELLK